VNKDRDGVSEEERCLCLCYNEAAQLLSVSPQMIRKLVETDQLRPIRVGRRVLFDPDDLRDFVDRLRA
jgi:excisionase family DNA binding protein